MNTLTNLREAILTKEHAISKVESDLKIEKEWRLQLQKTSEADKETLYKLQEDSRQLKDMLKVIKVNKKQYQVFPMAVIYIISSLILYFRPKKKLDQKMSPSEQPLRRTKTLLKIWQVNCQNRLWKLKLFVKTKRFSLDLNPGWMMLR